MARDIVHTLPRGSGAAVIRTSIEDAVLRGDLAEGERLPSIRALARGLGTSPMTVASAYSALRTRGIVTASRSGGTVVASVPTLRTGPRPSLPPATRDLRSGNPDPALLPRLDSVLEGLDPVHWMYGTPTKLDRLIEQANASFLADGFHGAIAVTGGALDAIERLLQTNLRPGDRVAVEDPTWPRITDLVRTLSLQLEPVELDDSGVTPASLAVSLERGAMAVIITPRGQNPTSAAIDSARAAELQAVLADHPMALVIEDDYLSAVSGAPYHTISGGTERWAVVRSLSKLLGPDLRTAVLTGDPLTVARLEARQLLGSGWVSHLLQQAASLAWDQASHSGLFEKATAAYAERRSALVDDLARQGVKARGRSGLGVWVPLEEEDSFVQHLLDEGWAVSPGERFRQRSGPGVRITTADLDLEGAERLAAAIAGGLSASGVSYLA